MYGYSLGSWQLHKNVRDMSILDLGKIVHNMQCSHHRGLIIVEPGFASYSDRNGYSFGILAVTSKCSRCEHLRPS